MTAAEVRLVSGILKILMCFPGSSCEDVGADLRLASDVEARSLAIQEATIVNFERAGFYPSYFDDCTPS